MRSFLRSKIHRATVTHADLHYEGSLSIDPALMEAADIAPFEEVHVWNITRGTRLTTYAIEAPSDSGVICANGAAAHRVQVGDLIIIATFQLADRPAAATLRYFRLMNVIAFKPSARKCPARNSRQIYRVFPAMPRILSNPSLAARKRIPFKNTPTTTLFEKRRHLRRRQSHLPWEEEVIWLADGRRSVRLATWPDVEFHQLPYICVHICHGALGRQVSTSSCVNPSCAPRFMSVKYRQKCHLRYCPAAFREEARQSSD